MATKNSRGKKKTTKKNNTIGLMIKFSPDMVIPEDLILECGIEDTTGLNVACECALCDETLKSTEVVKPKREGFFKRMWNKVFKA